MVTNNSNNIITSIKNSSSLTATTEELLDAFINAMDVKPSSRAVYRRSLRQYFRFIKDTGRDFRNLTREDIVAFKDSLLSSDGIRRSELTSSLYMCAVRQFYAWTEAHRLYPNIARGVRNPRHRQRTFKKMHLTSEQGRRYLEVFENEEHQHAVTSDKNNDTTIHRRFTNLESMSLRDRAIMTVMLYCGLRTVEVTRLNIGDITFRSGQRVLLVQGKGHDAKDAHVVLIDEAWGPLEQYLRTRKGALQGEPLFTCEGYNRRGRRMSARRLQAICKKGMRAIGLDGHEYSAHSLRHTTGVMIVKNGGSLLDVKTVLRHESTTTSQIYIESAMEEIRLQNAPEKKLEGCFRKAK